MYGTLGGGGGSFPGGIHDMLECPCSKNYIGKTRHQLRVHIGEHTGSMKHEDHNSPLTQHFAAVDDARPDELKVKSIYALNSSFCRGKFNTVLHHKEKYESINWELWPQQDLT